MSVIQFLTEGGFGCRCSSCRSGCCIVDVIIVVVIVVLLLSFCCCCLGVLVVSVLSRMLLRLLLLSGTRRLVVVVAVGPTRLFLGLVTAEEETVIPTEDDMAAPGRVAGQRRR